MKEFNAHYVIYVDNNETKETYFKDFSNFLVFREECELNGTLKGSYFYGDMDYFYSSTNTKAPEISATTT